MPAANDATCPKCHHRFGWFGEVTDKPPCPECGQKPNTKELFELKKEIDEMIAVAEREQDEKWKNRTPEEDDAYDRGKAAFEPDVRRIEVHRRNPHFTTVKEPTDPLSSWWMWGWNAAESEHYREKANAEGIGEPAPLTPDPSKKRKKRLHMGESEGDGLPIIYP